jgi:hypothetical protein
MASCALTPIGFALAVLLTADGLAGRQAAPVFLSGRDLADSPMPKGTGAAAGVLLDGRSNRPVPGAIVTIDRQGAILRALTDAQGRFAFANLPAGSFSLTATLGGYSPGALGRVRTGGSVQTVSLNDGERLADLSIRIWPLAVVEGTAADDRGEPIVGVTVRAYRRSYERGRVAWTAGPSGKTDDRGVFRITSLEPGDYLIAVPTTTYAWPASLENHLLLGGEHPPGVTASSVGQLPSLFGSGIHLSGASSLVVQTADRSAPAVPTADGHVAVYPAQFFAGAAAASDAAVLSLRPGDQRVDVRFTLQLQRGHNVSGVVASASGAADDLVLRLSPAGAGDTAAPIDTAVAVTDGRGRFVFVGVPPGQYTLRGARMPRSELAAASTGTPIVAVTSIRQLTEPPLPREAMQWVDAPITVGDGDVNDVSVTLQPGVRVRGRAEFRGTRPQPPAEAIARIRVLLEPADDHTAALAAAPLRGRVETDLQFATLAAPAGRYRLSVSGVPDGWALQSATAESHDVSVHPLDLEASEVRGVTLAFTDRRAALSGTVSGSSGARDATAAVIVFPADRSTAGVWESPRLVRHVRVDRTGSFVVSGLPPRSYFVAAIPDEMADGWQAPAFLESLSRVATRVEITDGLTSQIALRTVRPDVR